MENEISKLVNQRCEELFADARIKLWRLSSNPNITWDIIKANLDKKQFKSSSLSVDPCTNRDKVYFQRGESWHLGYIPLSPNINWDIIQENPDKSWNWHEVSKHPNITWNIIQANPDKPWSWHGISRNPNITWEIIQENPDKPWDWENISENPGIVPVNKFRQQVIRKYMRAFLLCKNVLPDIARIIQEYM